MKKIIIIIVLLLGSVFFGYKLYLINEIQTVIDKGKEGEFSVISKIQFIPSKFGANNEVNTNHFNFKTYEEFIESDLDLFKERTDRASFSWESGDNFKSVFISINSHRTGVLESLEEKIDVSGFLQQKITSDFDLHNYCFSLNHNNLNVFSTFHEIKVFSFCLVTRSVLLHRKGGVLSFTLPNSLHVIQIGGAGDGTIDLYFHDNKKELFSFNLRKFSDDDLNLLLSTIEIKH